MSGRAVAWALAALMVVDLWTIERLYWMFSPPAKVIYASDPIIEMLKAEAQPVRVLALPVRRTPEPDPFLTGDALMTHRIRNVLGYHGNQLGRYNELVGTNSEDNRLVSANVLRLTNTKFFLTNIPELPFIGNTYAGERAGCERGGGYGLPLPLQRGQSVLVVDSSSGKGAG